MKNAVLERINQVKNDLEIKSDREFCKRLGFNYNSFNTFLTRNSNPNIEFLTTLTNSFEQYNISWLLTGKGEMLLTKRTYDSPETTGIAVGQKLKQEKEEDYKDRYIGELEDNKKLLKKIFSLQEKIILLVEKNAKQILEPV